MKISQSIKIIFINFKHFIKNLESDVLKKNATLWKTIIDPGLTEFRHVIEMCKQRTFLELQNSFSKILHDEIDVEETARSGEENAVQACSKYFSETIHDMVSMKNSSII